MRPDGRGGFRECRGQLMQDNVLAEILVRQVIAGQEFVVKEMPVRPVADIVQQGRHTYQALNIGPRRHLVRSTGFAQ